MKFAARWAQEFPKWIKKYLRWIICSSRFEGFEVQIKRQILMGPTTVKMTKSGLMRKIANLQLEVPYFDMIVHKCACEKS